MCCSADGLFCTVLYLYIYTTNLQLAQDNMTGHCPGHSKGSQKPSTQNFSYIFILQTYSWRKITWLVIAKVPKHLQPKTFVLYLTYSWQKITLPVKKRLNAKICCGQFQDLTPNQFIPTRSWNNAINLLFCFILTFPIEGTVFQHCLYNKLLVLF